ncbi:MAG: phosphatidate cytidylyltransferase [Bacteroidota bacterium]|nr:phosphatidate cytidylyltransferase [Bacteroidota bacterium]
MTKFNFSSLTNFQQRLITGFSGAAIIFTCLVFNQWTYLSFIIALSIFGQLEFYRLIKEDGDDPLIKWGILNGTLLNIITYFVARGNLPTKAYLLFFVLLGVIYISELYRKSSNPFENIAYTIVGVFYVAMPLSLLHFAAFCNGYFSYQVASGVFILLWSNDTGAYFAGKAFGRNKLFQRISPGKTWEGLIGGLLLSLVMAYILSLFFSDLELWKWAICALIIGITGTYGDLIESMLKRSLQIKDSGNLIPGHGGILDRFDGMLMAAPFVAFFLEWI